MDKPIAEVCAIIDQHQDDELVPLDSIKQCIALLEQSSGHYEKQIEILRSQIGMVSGDDTSLFSAQLVSARLKTKILSAGV